MKITTRKSGDVTILDLTGKLTIGYGDAVLRGELQDALEGGAKNILLNLGGVATIDSSGIGELVSSYTRVTNRGGALKLLNTPPKVRDILHITQLITIFETYDDEAEAVKSYA